MHTDSALSSWSVIQTESLADETGLVRRLAAEAALDAPARAQITAADISRDGRWLAVLNYRRVYLWPKQGQGWGESVAAAPRVFEFPWIPQAEALAFDLEGRSLWISSERLPAPLMRIFPIQAE